MKQPHRTALAFLIAPISFGIVMFLVSLLMNIPLQGVWLLQFTAIIGYPVAMIVGLPCYVLLKWARLNGAPVYWLMSIVFSVLMIGLFIVVPAINQAPHFQFADLLLPARLGQMLIVMFACSVTVMSFWLVARPDRE